MTGQFKVGEVLEGQNITTLTEYNGCECVVIGGLRERVGYCLTAKDVRAVFSYKVRWSDGFETNTRPFNLRRKQPPVGEQSILNMFKLPAPKFERETA